VTAELWDRIFKPGTMAYLRRRTADRVDRMRDLLTALFRAESAAGWESWLLQLSPAARESLSIPSYYSERDLAQILGSDRGLAASQRTVVTRRVKAALVFVRKALQHQIRPPELSDFLATVDRLFRLVDSPPQIDREFETQEPFKAYADKAADRDIKGKDERDKRGKARGLLRQLAVTSTDAEFYALLTAVERSRSRGDTPKTETLFKVLKALLLKTDHLVSDVVVWWILAEIEATPDADLWTSQREWLLDRLGASNGDGVSQNHPLFDEVPEYSKIEAMQKLLIGLPILSLSAKAKLAKDSAFWRAIKGTGKKPSPSILSLMKRALGSRHGGGALKALDDPDQGLVAVAAVQLVFALEFWRWHLAVCGQKGADKFVEVGPQSIRYTKQHLWDAQARPGHANLGAVWNHFRELDKKGREKNRSSWMHQRGRENTVMLLGAPGIGKGYIEKMFWPKGQYRRIRLIPPEMGAGWHARVRTLPGGKKPVVFGGPTMVFIDEMHLHGDGCSVFGVLLKPIEEEKEFEEFLGEHVCWVFASSAFRNKEQFLREAEARGDVAMRDFATRIAFWVELPDLYTVPEQKLLLAYGEEGKPTLPEVVPLAFMHLGLLSARQVADAANQENPSKNRATLQAEVASQYPPWAIDAVRNGVPKEVPEKLKKLPTQREKHD